MNIRSSVGPAIKGRKNQETSSVNRFVVTESGLRGFLSELVSSQAPKSKKQLKEIYGSKSQVEKSERVFDRMNMEVRPAVRANVGEMMVV